MKSDLYTKLSSLLFFTLFSSMAIADSFRCGNDLVRTGDTSIEVKLKCGPPFDIEYIGQSKVNNQYVNIDRYTYVPEKGKFVKILEFHDGNLVKILIGPRV
ncbi:DUF2845 domain-containing protein [Paraglaciecola sp.]|uniref:DUF2845 domain-containing protein n=1 Tax=Paraglaciecola sp. TaxID=1920173 RepID=UPI0030F3815C